MVGKSISNWTRINKTRVQLEKIYPKHFFNEKKLKKNYTYRIVCFT